MRFDVRIEQDAEADLRSIAAYLAEHRSRGVARDFVAAMVARIESLERFPLRESVPREAEAIGRARCRQILFGRYRIVYRADAQQVIIVLIADSRRDMQALLRDRLLGHDRPG